jgi:hypothetical protein
VETVRKRNIKKLVVAAIVVIGCCYLMYRVYNPRIGWRSGQVVDAVTGKPIEGAVVSYVWEFGGFMEVVGESLAACYETVTDEEGRYLIPSQRAKRKTLVVGALKPESVIIYKDQYAVYTAFEYWKSDGCSSFGYPDKDQEYRNKNNLVKLYPWKNSESHQNHVYCIEWSRNYRRSQLLRKELEEEVKRAKEESM